MADTDKPDDATDGLSAAPSEVDGRDAAPGIAPRTPRSGRARRAAVVGLRVVAGTVGAVAAVVIVAAVGLAPVPSRAITPPTVVVTPDPADQTRLCAGALLRLGDETGQNAGTASAIGAPSVRSGAIAGSLQSAQLAASDAGTGGGVSAPQVLSIPGKAGATLSGAQSQVAEAQDYTGFSAASCAEPTSSLWLVGGATTVGRTSLVTIGNASAVDATVALTILGADGPISAPGMAGIVVKAGQQRVIPLAGFAPDLAAPVIHVVATGGQVTAYLQQSIVRGLDAGGVDLVNAGADPSTHVVIPGIRVLNAVGVNTALALPDWDDIAAAVRVAVPGAAAAKVHVSLIPQGANLTGLTFDMSIDPGHVDELPLDSGAETDSGGVAIPDGEYTVVLDSDQPIVGGARASTVAASRPSAGDVTTGAPTSDFAWYASAPVLTGDTAVSIAPGPSPQLAASNTTGADIALVLKAQGGQDLTVTVPARSSASIPVATGTTYLLQSAAGLVVAVSYAGAAQLAAYPVSPARPISGPITVHP